MSRTKPVLVIGDLNADLLLSGLSGHPRYGRDVAVSGCTLTLGGSGGLFASGLLRLGRDVRLLGKVGSDPTGDQLLALLRGRGLDVSGVRRDPKVGTGISVAFTDGEERALVSYPGAVGALTLKDLALGKLSQYSHLHLTSPFLQLGLGGEHGPLLKKAKKAGLTVSLDAGWDPRGRWDLKGLLPFVDVLLVNRPEAKALTGATKPMAAAKKLAEQVMVAVVRSGKQGAVAATHSGAWEAAGYPVDSVDATGAGAAFDSGFIDGWVDGHRVQEILAYACACASLSTRRRGGFDGQATRAEALHLVGGTRS